MSGLAVVPQKKNVTDKMSVGKCTRLGCKNVAADNPYRFCQGCLEKDKREEKKEQAVFQVFVDELKTAKLRGEEAVRDAVKVINRFQKKYGDSEDKLERLALAVGVTTRTLYRWKRQIEGSPDKKKDDKKPSYAERLRALQEDFFALRLTYEELRKEKPKPDVWLNDDEKWFLYAVTDGGEISHEFRPRLRSMGITDDEMNTFHKVMKAAMPWAFREKILTLCDVALRGSIRTLWHDAVALLPEFAESHKAQAVQS